MLENDVMNNGMDNVTTTELTPTTAAEPWSFDLKSGVIGGIFVGGLSLLFGWGRKKYLQKTCPVTATEETAKAVQAAAAGQTEFTEVETTK
jgi:hypothetical protein